VKRELPTFYYHAHFVELLDFVAGHYAHALEDRHARFVSDFRQLPHDARCLYVRLVNRKGRVYSARRLDYPELGDTQELLDVLRANGWVGPPDETHCDDLLGFLTRREIQAALSAMLAGVPRSLKKAQLLEFVRANLDPQTFVRHAPLDDLLVQRRASEVRYLTFLYFGRVQDGLSRFTMRDLGVVRTQSFRDSYEPRFADREEALEHFYFAERLYRLAGTGDGDVTPLVDEIERWPSPKYPGAAIERDRLAFQLGRRLEKAGSPFAALRVYQAGESARCAERATRLLLGNGQREEARQFLERLIDAPRGEEEYLFATDLYARKFGCKRTSTLTDLLRSSETIEIDEAMIGAPERAAAMYYEAAGARAFRVENALWRTLLGLLFWDILFEADDAGLHSPFEFLPRELADGEFASRRSALIEERLAMLDDAPGVTRFLLKTSARVYGTANGVFRWRRSILDAVFALLGSAAPAAVRSVLRRLAADYRNSRYGYPDLMIIDDDGPRFVEVKTDGDQLRRNQLLRIEQLREAGFRADVVRIRWTLDPGQTYVVVDVETTGGRGQGHRVTELGAAKVQDGRIVDRFCTLLNPGRSIPPSITRLTGITAAMVADAPSFADIADEFEAFIDGSIFVAHNVEFDYRFISHEFARLGRKFRLPKLCTCATMRKLFPGHRSYSLAALCEAYDVPLERHHRAMSDAEAAAGLLLLINEKRAAALAAGDEGPETLDDVGELGAVGG